MKKSEIFGLSMLALGIVGAGFAVWDLTEGSKKNENGEWTLTVNSSPAAGGTTNPSGQTSHADGDVLTVTAIANSGYTFDHWSGGATGTSPSIQVTMTKNLTITANFTQGGGTSQKYTLTVEVDPAGGGSVSGLASGGLYAANAPVSLTAKAASGFTFEGWTGDEGASGSPTLTFNMPAEDITVTASFSSGGGSTPPPTTKYTVTLKAGAGGSVSPATQSILATEDCEISAYADATHTFLNWTDASGNIWSTQGTGTDYSDVVFVPTANITLTANFAAYVAPKTVVLTLNINPWNGGDSDLDQEISQGQWQQTVELGVPVTITVTPNVGFSFKSWTSSSGAALGGTANGDEYSYTFTPAANTTITANFTANTTAAGINFQVSPAGAGDILLDGAIVPVGTFSQNLTNGERLTLGVQAASGYYFDHWSGNATLDDGSGNSIDGSTTNPVDIVLDQPSVNVTAVFALNSTNQCMVTVEWADGSTHTYDTCLPGYWTNDEDGNEYYFYTGASRMASMGSFNYSMRRGRRAQ